MDESQLPPEVLEKLQEYNKALESEWGQEESSTDDKIESARTIFRNALPDAAETLVTLSKFADSESVKASCARFIYTSVVGKPDGSAKDDPVESLIKQLTADEPSDS